DLLGRKLWQSNGLGLQTLLREIQATLQQAAEFPDLAPYSEQLQEALLLVNATTQSVGEQLQQQGPDIGLANASAFLSLSGHVVVAWLWLWQASAAMKGLKSGTNAEFYRGKLHACRFFFRWELPKIQHWSNLLQSADDTCRTMHNDYF
ncbi:MAG: acyl-CoA dehydrogenase, partial [Pseudomonadales bacterium]|nr:acyl-CoA dehydrogenase [Pseudomonadales bacterium]